MHQRPAAEIVKVICDLTQRERYYKRKQRHCQENPNLPLNQALVDQLLLVGIVKLLFNVQFLYPVAHHI